MDFSDALRAVKAGKRVKRLAWRDCSPMDIVRLARFGVPVGDLLSDDWLIVDDQEPAESVVNRQAPTLDELKGRFCVPQTPPTPPRKPKIGDVVVCHRPKRISTPAIVTSVNLGGILVATIGDGASEAVALRHDGLNCIGYRWSWPD